MKRILITTTAMVTAFCGLAHADESMSSTNTNAVAGTPVNTYNQTAPHGQFGAGIIVGEPTGVSLKYFLTEAVAVDGAAGWSFDDNDADPYLHADLLFHKYDLIPATEGRWAVYTGAGGRVRFRDHADNQAGIRVPVGVSYEFDRMPVDVFAEVAPVIDFTPALRGGITGGIGVRWWF